MTPVETYRWNGTTWDLMHLGPHPATITPPDDGPTPTYQDMLVGAAVGTGTQAQLTTLETALGQQLHVYRSYDSGFPATWQQGAGSWHPDRFVSWHSLKPSIPNTASGALDAQLTAWVQSIPTSHQCMLTFQHEPENPNKGNDAATWRTAFRRFYDIVKSVRPDIPVGPILMGWTYDPRSGRSATVDWNPGADKVDFYGVDEYQSYLFPPAGSPTTWDPYPAPNIQRCVEWAATQGKPAAVGETACGDYQGDFTKKRDWIKGNVDYFAANNGIAFCYFNTLVNNDMSPNSLLTDDSLTETYYGSVLADPPQITSWT